MIFILVKIISWFSNQLCKKARVSPPVGEWRNKPRRRGLNPEKVAKQIRGKLVTSGRNFDIIRFRQFGNKYKVSIKSGFGAHTISLKGEWPRLNYRLRVFPDAHGGGRYYGMKDIDVGDRRFDQDFVVQSNDQRQALELLNEDVRYRIVKHRRLAHGRITITVGNGSAELGGMTNGALRTTQLVTLIRNLVDIHQLMLNAFSTDGKLEMKVSEMEQSICMVCGDSVGDEGVDCQNCDTRHHRECWSYIGKCSTYGCRSRRYT